VARFGTNYNQNTTKMFKCTEEYGASEVTLSKRGIIAVGLPDG